MNIRSQIARLQQQAGRSQFSNDVREISSLMDELSALAAGGGLAIQKVTLQEILSSSQPIQRKTP